MDRCQYSFHWYLLSVCWHLFAFIYLAMRCYLWYLQLFFDICQYLQIFVDICWHVLLFVDTCWSLLLLVVILLLFFSICWYSWTKWSFFYNAGAGAKLRCDFSWPRTSSWPVGKDVSSKSIPRSIPKSIPKVYPKCAGASQGHIRSQIGTSFGVDLRCYMLAIC